MKTVQLKKAFTLPGHPSGLPGTAGTLEEATEEAGKYTRGQDALSAGDDSKDKEGTGRNLIEINVTARQSRPLGT
jgi:hypothetical protein